jgi:hypothetical protein
VREINGQAGASLDRKGSTRVRSDGWPTSHGVKLPTL